MDYKIEKLENNKVKITLKLNEQEWQEELNNAYNKTKADYTIAGFRKGKAPRARIEKEYGETIFYNDAISQGFQKRYIEILDKEKNIEPLDTPSLDIKDLSEKGVTIEATVDVYPEVKVKKYTGFGVKAEVKEATEEDVKAELDRFMEQQVRFVEKPEATLELGNIANIDFEGSVDGVVFEGGTAKGYDLELGSKSFIEGFEEQLVGLKVNDEKDVNVTFPENYHVPELAGKPAVFKTKVNAVKVKEYPELNDELIANVTDKNTLDEFKAEIRENLTKQFERDAKIEQESKILEMVLENTEANVPEILVDQEVDHMISDFEMRLMYQGLDLNAYINYLGVTAEQFREDRKEDARKNVLLRLAVQEIVKAEKLEPTEQEIDFHLSNLAINAKITLEEYKKGLDDHAWSHINSDIIMGKVLRFLVEKN